MISGQVHLQQLPLVLAGVLSLAGCGGSSDSTTVTPPVAPPVTPPVVLTGWDAVRAAARPLVVLTSEFATPHVQPIAVDGWEDGICISRDGLHLYAVYAPADLLSYVLGGADAAHAADYLRGPTLGMDLTTNPPLLSFPTWLHANIVQASRTAVDQPFSAWRLAAMQRPTWSEGAPFVTGDTGSGWDLFVHTTNEHDPDYKAHICLARNAAKDPAALGTLLPAPVTTNTTEDNPHIERLDSTHLVLFFDSDDRPGGVGLHDLWLTTSADDGVTWAVPSSAISLNSTGDEEQPHLYHDGAGTWWMYFTASNPDDHQKLAIYRAQQTTVNDWTTWGTRELVVSAGNTAGVGEPTLTAVGDLSFVVVMEDTVHGTPTNRFDADPWFAPHLPSGIGRKQIAHPPIPAAAVGISASIKYAQNR